MATCPFDGCNTQITHTLFACRPHWYRLKIPQRDEIWAAYRRYQAGTLDLEGLRAIQQHILDLAQGNVSFDGP